MLLSSFGLNQTVCCLSPEAEWRGGTGPSHPVPRRGSPPAAVLPVTAALRPGRTPAGGTQRTRHVPHG